MLCGLNISVWEGGGGGWRDGDGELSVLEPSFWYLRLLAVILEMVDWPGLLKWSLSQTDATRPSEFRPMDESTRLWLREALESFAFQEKEKLRKISEILSTPETGDPEELTIKDSILDELMSIIDNPELASNFIHCGGVQHLIRCMLGSRYVTVRRSSSQVFSSAVQNNPSVQSYAHSQGVLQGLLDAVRLEPDISTKETYMSSLSALVRGEFALARKDFVENGGIDLVKGVIQEPVSLRIVKKSLLLVINLFYYDHYDPSLEIVPKAVQSGFIPLLLSLETQPDLEVRQMALQAIHNLKRGGAAHTVEIDAGLEGWRKRIEDDRERDEERSTINELLRST